MPDLPTAPVACKLNHRDLEARIAWIEELNARQLLSRARHGPALTLTYRASALGMVRELVANERQCCAFLDFEITESAESVALTITVPADHAASADALLHPFTAGLS